MAKKSDKTEIMEIRKAPKFLPFMLTGALVGLIVGIVLNAMIPAANRTGQDIFGYIVLFMMAVGFSIATVVAVILDWVSRARIKQVEATKLKG